MPESRNCGTDQWFAAEVYSVSHAIANSSVGGSLFAYLIAWLNLSGLYPRSEFM